MGMEKREEGGGYGLTTLVEMPPNLDRLAGNNSHSPPQTLSTSVSS